MSLKLKAGEAHCINASETQRGEKTQESFLEEVMFKFKTASVAWTFLSETHEKSHAGCKAREALTGGSHSQQAGDCFVDRDRRRLSQSRRHVFMGTDSQERLLGRAQGWLERANMRGPVWPAALTQNEAGGCVQPEPEAAHAPA